MGEQLAGKVAVITGGASGIGLASAERFLREGAKVVIADFNEASGAKAMDAFAAAGLARHARFVRADVSSDTDVAAMIAAAVESFGRLDIVFNNAGVGGAFGSITDIEVEDWDYTFAVLVRGVFLGIKHGARQMIAQGEGGSIINTASISGLSGSAGPLAYSAAKGSVVNLTRAAAVELAPQRIRVNAVCPGPILTPLMTMHASGPEGIKEIEDDFKQFVPWPDIGRPDDIAGPALFLASDDSTFLTGDIMVVDGGAEAVGPGIMLRSKFVTTPTGITGAHRGTTGEGPVIRKRKSA